MQTRSCDLVETPPESGCRVATASPVFLNTYLDYLFEVFNKTVTIVVGTKQSLKRTKLVFCLGAVCFSQFVCTLGEMKLNVDQTC